jgi:hypothetical protein
MSLTGPCSLIGKNCLACVAAISGYGAGPGVGVFQVH